MLPLSFKWICLIGAAGACTLAMAQLPQRDLLIEIRRTADRPAHSYGSSASAADSELKPQTMMVRNGEKASTRLNISTPVEWTQRVESSATPITTPSPVIPGLPQSTGAAVTKSLQWMDAGQSVSITPRWPGGKRPVLVELEMRSAAIGQSPGDALPSQGRSELNTTVTVPLGEWVTVAKTGHAPADGSYRSGSTNEASQLIQLRISIP